MLRDGEVEEPFKLMQREKAVVPEASSSIYVIEQQVLNSVLDAPLVIYLPSSLDSKAGLFWRIS